MSAIDCTRDVAVRRGPVVVGALLTMLVTGLCPSASAQENLCDQALLKRAEGAHPYKLRGDRCEGLYRQQVGGPTLFVASLTEFFEDYDVSSAKPLVVEWSQPAPGDVQLRAQGLKHNLYYRMDSRRSAGTQSYNWPSDVLRVRTIKSADIGVLGWMRHQVGSAPRDVYVSLRVRQSQSAVSCGTYALILFPGVRLEEVYVSLASLKADGSPAHWFRKDTPLGFGFYPAGKPIRVPITELEAQGVHYLGISAKLSNDGSPTALERWFYHAGNSPACG